MPQLNPGSILGPGGSVSRYLAGYEVREEQLQMAEAVARAIESRAHLMVEAGTGVGKTFAYLVPAIMAAADFGKRVIVSTRTINLQEQLVEKDVPLLQMAMPHQFKAVLAKGRSNYVSLRRLDVALARGPAALPSPGDFSQLGEMLRQLGRNAAGSASELDFQPARAVWEAVESDTTNCLAKKCPRYRECYFFKAARRTWSADIIIVNHALLMSDLALRVSGRAVLPEYDVAIIDEAHTLAAIAAQHLGLRVASGAIVNMITRICGESAQHVAQVPRGLSGLELQARRALLLTDEFFDAVADWQARHGTANGRVRRPTGLPETLVEELGKLATALGETAERASDDEQRIELVAAQSRCASLATDLMAWLRHDDPDSVYWVVPRKQRGDSTVLAAAPLNIGEVLRGVLFDRVPTCILTSATLSVGNPPRFDFSRSRLGLTTGATRQLGSPFDFSRQAKVIISRNMPDPSTEHEAFERAVIEVLPRHIEKTHGKALVLFTSHDFMGRAAQALAPWFRTQEITLLSQSHGQSRSRLIEAFRRDIDSVLFGTDSFWQGVDVPGAALSQVVITRLPFGITDHPLLEGQLEQIKRDGGHPFLDYQLPSAALRFKQGIGRLIRSKMDTGLVTILDPRVLTKPYGRVFRESLPPGMPVEIDLSR